MDFTATKFLIMAVSVGGLLIKFFVGLLFPNPSRTLIPITDEQVYQALSSCSFFHTCQGLAHLGIVVDGLGTRADTAIVQRLQRPRHQLEQGVDEVFHGSQRQLELTAI